MTPPEIFYLYVGSDRDKGVFTDLRSVLLYVQGRGFTPPWSIAIWRATPGPDGEFLAREVPRSTYARRIDAPKEGEPTYCGVWEWIVPPKGGAGEAPRT